ncbi:MAG: GAF domain-containing protein [Anaerolineae bacterium]|nr:GAF domain-containing protein [Anaerolineae bacterium]
MINTLTKHLDQSDMQHEKALLLLTIRIFMLLALGHALAMAFISNQWLVPVILDISLCIAFGAARGLVHLKYFRITRAWISGSLWLYITISNVLLGGLENPLIGSYIVFVLVVGLLYNVRWLLYALVLSISTILLIAIAQINQVLPASFIDLTPIYLSLNILAATIGVALMMYFFLNVIQHKQAISLQREQNIAALHEVTIELANYHSLEEILRNAVALGLRTLRFDRLSVFLLDEGTQTAVGTYGTDAKGHIRNENHLFHPLAEMPTIKESLETKQTIFVKEDVELMDNGQVVGSGWNVIITLWDGGKILGWLAADNLISQEPLNTAIIDLLASYSTILAQVIVRKQTEENLRFSQRRLQSKSQFLSTLNKLAERLHQAHDTDSIFKSMADTLTASLNTPMVVVYLLDEQKQILNRVFEVNAPFTPPLQLRLESSLSGYAINYRTVAITQDFLDDERLSLNLRHQLAATDLDRIIFIPIIFGDEVFGVINLGFAHDIQQETSDYQTYAAIGQTVGLALSNIRFINEIQLEKTLSDSIIESIPNVFFMFSEDGELVRWNANLANLLDYDNETLYQLPALAIVMESDRDSLDVLLAQTLKRGSSSAYLHISTRDQGDVPHIFSTRRYQIKEKQYIIGTGDDLSERMKLLERLQYQATQLHTAGDISKSIVTVLDTDELMQYSVDLVCQRFDYYYVGLFIADKEHQFATLAAGSGDAGRKLLESGFRLAIDNQSMIGRCIGNAESIIVSNVELESGHYTNPNLPDTQSEMALPLMNRGACLGAITVQSSQLDAFSSDDSAVMRFIADHLASAVVNARLYEFINSRQRYFGTLRRVTQRAMPAHNLKVFMQTVVETLSEEFQYDFAAIFLVDYEASVIRIGAFISKVRRELDDKLWPIKRGIMGWIVKNAKPYICYDSTKDSYMPHLLI